MPEPVSCPDSLDLSDFVLTTSDTPGGSRVENHLSQCGGCRARVAELWRSVDALEAGKAGSSRLRNHRLVRIGSLAAAGLLLAIAAGVYLDRRSLKESVSVDSGLLLPPQQARLVDGIRGEASTAPGREEWLRLPDGSLLRLFSETRIRFLPALPSGRYRVELIQGALEAAIAKGADGWRVVNPAGEIRVLGTRFLARSFQVRELGGERSPSIRDVLCVEVREGKISLRNARGEEAIGAGIRGIALSGMPPLRQEFGGLEKVLAGFASLVEEQEGAFAVRRSSEKDALYAVATFWGGYWADGLDWRPLLAAPEPRLRAAAALLAASRNPAGARQALAEAAQGEQDARVRALLVRLTDPKAAPDKDEGR